MSWAKLDDSFHSHLKVRGVWYRCQASIGLHAMAITFAADQETDGVIPAWFVAGCFQRPKDLEAALDALLDSGMWKRQGEDFLIHDFLDYHTSKAQKKEDADRKKRERSGEVS